MEELIVLVKKDHEISYKEFIIMNNILPCKSEYLMISKLTFEDNIIYLN